MFDIDNLIIPKLRERLDDISDLCNQVAFLLKFLDYDLNFPKDEAEISRYCKTRCNKVYDMSLFRSVIRDKESIVTYGKRVNSLEKTKDLINELCNDILEDTGNYDDILQNAINDTIMLQNSEEMDFLEHNDIPSTVQYSSLNRVLGMKDKVGDEPTKK